MEPYLLTKTKKILHITICRKGYADSLASSDFHVFGLLKEVKGGKSFRSDEET